MLCLISSLFTRKSSSQTLTMTTTPTNNPNTNESDKSKSRFLPTECLADWWLAKAEDETQGMILAVSGQSLAGKQPRRFCSSLPILKRHDVFTLETTDGKTVILKGFLNKDRSIKNGFPSHVCNHFMFGFPDYWKTCTQPYMVKEPSPDMSPPKSGCVTSDSKKKSNKINNLDGAHDSPSKVKFGSGMTSLEEISSDIKIKARRRYMGKCSRGMISSEMISSDTKNEAMTHSISSLEMKQMNSQASYVLDSPLKDQLDRSMTSPEEFSIDSKNKARKRSLSISEMEQKNSIASVKHSGGEKTRLKSVSLSLDFDKVELVHGESNQEVNKDLHVEDNTRLNESNNDSTVPHLSEKSNPEKNMKRVQTRGLVKHKSKSKATPSLSKPASSRKAKSAKASHLPETSNPRKDMARVQTRASKATPSLTKPISDKRSLSENAKAPSTRRKLAYETPKREKKRAPVDSPQLSEFKRSRSGRLLTPRLEFWRNQRTICNADGTVTGIKSDLQPEKPITGSKTTARRKRRQL